MTSLRDPIREVLQDGVSEETIQRVWRGVRRRREPRARFDRRSLLAVAATALVAVLAFVWVTRAPSLGGPLREANGQTLNSLGATTASSTWLADGSRIDLGPGASLEVLTNDASEFVCVLRRGRGTFEVKPGGQRRWRVEAGALRVEVVGTIFSVDRSEARVGVDVERGTVLVRGERVPDGVQKLTAGSRLSIDLTPPAQRLGSGGHAALPEATSVANSPAPPLASQALPAAPSVDLMRLADEQRRHGNLKGAIASLRAAAVERSWDDSRRAIAAFTLGKLLLDGASRPAEAAAAFRSCLRLSPPSTVAEDASARLVEALSRAGNADAARRSANDYEHRYPNGRRLADVRRWASVH